MAASIDNEIFLAHRFAPVETERDWLIPRLLRNSEGVVKTDIYVMNNFLENDRRNIPRCLGFRFLKDRL